MELNAKNKIMVALLIIHNKKSNKKKRILHSKRIRVPMIEEKIKIMKENKNNRLIFIVLKKMIIKKKPNN